MMKPQVILILVVKDEVIVVACTNGTEEAIRELIYEQFGRIEIPKENGFHIWDGRVEHQRGDTGPGGNDPQESESFYHGEWREAKLADLAKFDVVLPAK